MNTSLRNLASIVFTFLLVAAAPDNGLLYKIPYTGAYFTTDHLGNLYVVKQDNSILKYNPKGELIASINNKLLGRLEYMDVSNPFELYLYYKDQNRIVYTDNMLGNRGETDLNKLEVANIGLIARSYDNHIWTWDQNDLQLKKYSKDLKLLSESGNSRMWAKGLIEPAYLIDNGQLVLMSDPKVGIYVFDAFANYFKTIPAEGVGRFQVNGDKIVFFHNNRLSVYDMKRLEWNHIDSLQAFDMRYEPGYRFISKNDSLYVEQLAW